MTAELVGGHSFQDLVDQPEFTGFHGRHKIVAIRPLLDRLQRLARVFGQQMIQSILGAKEFLGVDQNLFRGAFGPGERLVDHDPRVW